MTDNHPRTFVRDAITGANDGGTATGISPIAAYGAGSPYAIAGATFGFNAYDMGAIAHRQAASVSGNHPRTFLHDAIAGAGDGGTATGISPISAYGAGSPYAIAGATFGFNAYDIGAIPYRQAAGVFAGRPPSSGFSQSLATGQNASGGIQTTGDLADANWTVSNADNYKNGPIAYTVAPGNADWYGQWMADGPSSSWIAADPDTKINGNVTYTITFNLSGYDPADAILSGGEFMLDDGGTVYLNGHALGSQAFNGWQQGFTALSSGAGDFVADINTIVIQTTGSDHQFEAARLEGTIVDTVSSGPPGPVHWASPISGNFTTGADWTGGAVPGANSDAILDAAGSTAYTVTSSTSETVNSIQAAATATLGISSGTFTAINGTGTGANAGTIQIGHGSSFTVGGSLVNNGTIEVASNTSDAATSLVIAGSTTLGGAGKVVLSDQVSNQIVGGDLAVTLTNIDNTISGAGTIGAANLILINQRAGIIDATGANRLTLDTGPNAIVNAGLIEATGAGGMTILSALTNTGSLVALGAGALTVQNAVVTNTGGTLTDAAGGHVSLVGGTIMGGTVSIAAGGLLSADSGSSALGVGTFTNAGTISVKDAASLAIGRSLVNSGTIAVSSTGSGAATSLAITSGTTLSGAGQVILSDQIYNEIAGGVSAVSLTNVDNTISGAGTIGSSTLTLVNRIAGVIDATGANRLILNTGTNAIVDAGLIEATGSGGMTIESAVANAGGVISAGDGSRIALLGADVIGGTLETIGDAAIRIKAAAASVLDGTASTIDDQAQIVVTRRAALTIEGSIANGKGIRLAGRGVGSPTLTVGAAGVTLSGGGTIGMDDSAGDLIIGASSAATLTNIDNFIGGAGRLGGGQLTLVNEAMGVISGNQATALIIDTGANTVVNAGLIVARGAGGTTIASAVANSGILKAVGAVLNVNGAVSGSGVATIDGGAIDFASSFSQTVTFEGGAGALRLAQSQGYGGTISGFSKTGGTSLDLGDIGFVSAGEATFSGAKIGGVLTVTDGTHTASLTLDGDYRSAIFTASSDGHGGTIVVDGPTSASTQAFVAAMAGMGASSGQAIHTREAGLVSPAVLGRPHACTA